MNIVVLRGRLTRPAQLRILPSGDRLVALDVSVTRPGDRAESVPVVWLEAPASAAGLDVDQEVVVVGRVRRRFFRTSGVTRSSTEVVADHVVPAKQAKKAQRLVLAACGAAEEAVAGR